MASIRLISLVVFILFAQSAQRTPAGAQASPTIQTVTAPKPHEITGKLLEQEHQVGDASLKDPQKPLIPITGAGSDASQDASNKSASRQERATTAEKLKRGLANFVNNLNPAPFFVPQRQPAAAAMGAAAKKVAATTGSQAEPVTIINDGPSAAALIKGPNRLVQARPLGGPPRWGRRR